jgi:hypothetical protein
MVSFFIYSLTLIQLEACRITCGINSCEITFGGRTRKNVSKLERLCNDVPNFLSLWLCRGDAVDDS